jgi:hypothetical protein
MSITATKQTFDTFVPVTGFEEIIMPSAQERAELIASLEKGRAEIARGNFVVHTRESFKKFLMDSYHGKTS